MKNAKWYGIGLGVLLLVVFLVYSIMTFSYSDGERSGVVIKFSNKGMMIKTWEGELSQGSMMEGGVPKVWEFSVVDQDIVDKVKIAARQGNRATLVYEQYLFPNPFTRSTNYVLIDVLDESGTSLEGAQ